MTGPGVPTGNVYPKYDSAQRVERFVVGRFLRSLERAVGDGAVRTPATVLDLGAGEGEVARRLCRRFPAATLVTVDLADAALAGDWKGGGWSPLFADAGHLPLRDHSIDLVLAIEVLEHLADPRAALAEITRVAADRVVLSVPCEPLWRFANVLRGRYWSARGNTPGHLQHWGRRSFTSIVAEHLDVVEVLGPLPWTMVVARGRRATTEPPARPPMPPPLPARPSP